MQLRAQTARSNGINEALFLSKLANRLLSELESVDADTLTSDSNHSRKIQVVLDSFEQVELMIYEHQFKRAGKIAGQTTPRAGRNP